MNVVKVGEFVRMHAGDFEALLAENRRLYAQVAECQAANAALLERARDAESFIPSRDHYREGLAVVLRASLKAGRLAGDPAVRVALTYLGEDADYYERKGL